MQVRQHFKECIFILAFLVLNGWLYSSAYGATYYVSKNGNDSNTCAQAQNVSEAKLTITNGMTCLAGGDVLIVKAGTYDENLVINVPSGTASSYTTIKAAASEAVWIRPTYFDTETIYQSIMEFEAPPVSYIKIERINLDGSGYPSSTEYGVYGIYTRGAGLTEEDPTHHLIFDGMEIKETRGNSAILGKTYETTVRNSYHHDTNTSVVDTSGAGCVYFQPNDPSTYGGIIEDNIFENCAAGVNVSGRNGFIIQRNTIKNADLGITLKNDTSNGIIRNNLISNGERGIRFTSGASWTDIKIYNNTIYNISHSDPQKAGCIQYGTGLPSPFPEEAAANIKNNICWNATTTYLPSGNFTADPHFVNAPGGDFHLQSSSPAIDTGITLTEVQNDFDGVTRPIGSGYDFGAYEFSSCSP